ncbi:MAG: ABC transporter permease [Acidobacteria bacterium]|nr:ABC transporter permease [Acidobacteriota bacterium]
MGTIWQDLRYGFRMLWKSPGFTTVALLALALGIGANTAIFSVVNAVLLRPLPYRDPERLTLVWWSAPKLSLDQFPASAPDFVDWKTRSGVFERVAAFKGASFNLTGGNEPERVQSAAVSADLFPMLGVQPRLGRAFADEEEQPGHEKVALVSDGLWQRRFGANPGLVGQQVALNGESYTVVGVLPPNFNFPEGDTKIDLWVPLSFDPKEMSQRGSRSLIVAASLKPGVTREQAGVGMNLLAKRMAEEYPATNADWGIQVQPLTEAITEDQRPALLILFAAVGFVLAVACANVANLHLVRAATRHKEVAVRVALGASRLRLVRQFLTESVLLAGVGGVLGLLLAVWGVDALKAVLPSDVPRLEEIGVDASALGFTLLVSLSVGVLLGLAPALQRTRPDVAEVLKEGSQSVAGGLRRNRVRAALVIAEVALALMLLTGAGLMLRSFWQLREVSLGLDPENVLTMKLTLPAQKYEDASRQTAFSEQLLQRVMTMSGVASAAITTSLPLSDTSMTDFVVEGHLRQEDVEDQIGAYSSISTDYFRALRIPVIRGRAFNEQDTEKSAPVVIISETLARAYFGDEDPVGRRIKTGDGDEEGGEAKAEGKGENKDKNNAGDEEQEQGKGGADEHPWMTIVGVVGDVHRFGLDEKLKPEIYFPYRQQPGTEMALVVRAASNPSGMTAAVRREVRAVDAEQPVYDIETMSQLLSESIATRRLSVVLLAVFAALALVLAAVGIYGVVSYSVAQRTHEIGVRMALGAQGRDVLRLVVGQGMILVCVGLLLGIGASLAVMHTMSSLLFGVSATDPATFACVSVLLAVIALLACYIPARRAAKVDPMVALRYE